MIERIIFKGFWLLSFTLGAIAPAVAQPTPSLAPFDITYLRDESTIPPDVITHTSISQTNLTVPSLWWANQQFGRTLVETWFAYPNASQRRVDFVVNRQVWSLLDYLQRYEFVHHMGSVARTYGYNIRIFNRQGEALATYTCDLNLPDSPCDMRLQAAQDGLRGPRQSPLLPSP
ncbi:MAG: hypothetical protein F6K32_11095 [Desertifilum sp. SIO1I2]|nr:hypothetical protein [Desertifilum sp. SIO1I2]